MDRGDRKIDLDGQIFKRQKFVHVISKLKKEFKNLKNVHLSFSCKDIYIIEFNHPASTTNEANSM